MCYKARDGSLILKKKPVNYVYFQTVNNPLDTTAYFLIYYYFALHCLETLILFPSFKELFISKHRTKQH